MPPRRAVASGRRPPSVPSPSGDRGGPAFREGSRPRRHHRRVRDPMCVVARQPEPRLCERPPRRPRSPGTGRPFDRSPTAVKRRRRSGGEVVRLGRHLRSGRQQVGMDRGRVRGRLGAPHSGAESSIGGPGLVPGTRHPATPAGAARAGSSGGAKAAGKEVVVMELPDTLEDSEVSSSSSVSADAVGPAAGACAAAAGPGAPPGGGAPAGAVAGRAALNATLATTALGPPATGPPPAPTLIAASAVDMSSPPLRRSVCRSLAAESMSPARGFPEGGEEPAWGSPSPSSERRWNEDYVGAPASPSPGVEGAVTPVGLAQAIPCSSQFLEGQGPPALGGTSSAVKERMLTLKERLTQKWQCSVVP